ncbi:MAG TPA: PspC domain-containing protein [Acidimicrobiales bacterium]
MSETDPSTSLPPPPPPPPSTGPTRLTRSSDDRIIAGVAGGVAQYFAIDPVIVRIVFVVICLANGIGVLIYLAGWLMIPPDDGHPSVGARVSRGLPFWTIIGAVLLVVVAIPAVFGLMAALLRFGFAFGGGIAIPLLIVAAAMILLDRGRTRGTAADDQTISPLVEEQPAHDRDGARHGPPPPPHLGYRRQDRGPSITAMTLSVMLIGLGVVILATQQGAEPSATAVAAGGLTIVGLGLLVGSRVGRARGLIPVGVLLTLAVTAASTVDGRLSGGLGERTYAPTAMADVRSSYRLLAGDQTLDLTRLVIPPSQSVEIEITQGAGEMLLLLPEESRIVASAHVGAGQLRTPLAREDNGVGLDADFTWAGSSERGVIVVDAKLGVGDMRIDIIDTDPELDPDRPEVIRSGS